MKTVTPNELGQFAESLLQGASQQTEILIVQDGEPVARIERTEKRRLEIKALIERIRENRKGQRLDGLSIRELIDEGRP